MTMVADLDTSLSPEPAEDKTAQKAEISRGRREFRQHLPALRERFPLVFPEDIKAVKPLHHSVTAAVAQAMGWTFPFARGVVKGYKLSIPYCHAVLRHRERIGPDGEPVAGSTVDDADRFSARCRIDDFARHKKERREREQAEAAQASGVPIPPPDPVPFVPPPIPPTVPADEPDPEPIPPPPVQQAVPTRPTLTLKKAVALPTAVRADVRSITVAAPLRKDRLGR
jgi:hypothetical protein